MNIANNSPRSTAFRMGTSVRDFGSKLRPGNAAFVVFWCVLIFSKFSLPRALKVISNGGDLKLFSRSRWVRTAASEKVRLHPIPTGIDDPGDIIIFENEFGLLQIDGRPSLLSRSLYEITSCRLSGFKFFPLPTTLPLFIADWQCFLVLPFGRV